MIPILLCPIRSKYSTAAAEAATSSVAYDDKLWKPRLDAQTVTNTDGTTISRNFFLKKFIFPPKKIIPLGFRSVHSVTAVSTSLAASSRKVTLASSPFSFSIFCIFFRMTSKKMFRCPFAKMMTNVFTCYFNIFALVFG